MDFINCEVCNRNETILLYEIHGYKIVRCKNCGLVYVNPQPTGEELNNFYTEIFFSPKWYIQFPQLTGFDYFKKAASDISGFKSYVDQIVKYKSNGRLLDVGAGDGHLLKFAKRQGFQVWGVEPSPKAANKARKIVNAEIINDFFENVQLSTNFFDVAVSIGTIEHLKNPKQVIEKMHQLLKTDGLLVLQTPNIDSWQYRKQKEKWEQFTVPGHLFYFSPKTLSRLLKEIGFKIVFINQYIPFWMGPLYGSISQKEILKPWQKLLKSFSDILPSKVSSLLGHLKGKFMGRHDLIIYALKKK